MKRNVSLPSGPSGLRGPAVAWLLVGLAVCVVLCYLPALGAGLVNWDDDINIAENPHLNPVTWRGLAALWRGPYEHLYVPLPYTLWALPALLVPERAAARVAPWVYHAVNLLAHVLTAFIVFRLLGLLLRARGHDSAGIDEARVRWAALLGAMFFAVHPLQVEAVAWVTGAKDVLAGLLSLASVLAYLRMGASSERPARRVGWAVCASAAYGLALLAKPSAAITPLLGWWLARPRGAGSDSSRSAAWRVPGLVLLAAWTLAGAAWVGFTAGLQPAVQRAYVAPVWARLPIAADAVAFYLYKLALPLSLAADYGRSPDRVLAQPGWCLGALGVCAAGTVAFLRLGRRPLWRAAAGVWLLGLLPVLGFIPFGFQDTSTVADRYVYVAMLGPAIGVAALAVAGRRAVWASCAVLLALLGLRTAVQAARWHDSQTLFRHAVATNPFSYPGHSNLGHALLAAGRTEEAIEHFSIARSLRPKLADSCYNLALAESKAGRVDRAVGLYSEALAIRPGFARAHNNLAVALHEEGRLDLAIFHYSEALRLGPRLPATCRALGDALVQGGRAGEAVGHYSACQSANPRDPGIDAALGAALFAANRAAEALAAFSEAVRKQADSADVHFNLGVVLAQLDRPAAALAHYEAALRLAPTHEKALNNLGRLLLGMGRIEAAIACYSDALRANPGYARAHSNLGAAYAQRGDGARAAYHFSEALKLEPSLRAPREFFATNAPPAVPAREGERGSSGAP